jgi:hypothetical protein
VKHRKEKGDNMTGIEFMKELYLACEGVRAIGQSSGMGGILPYSLYIQADNRLIDFIKKQELNIVACLDCHFNDDYGNDRRFRDFLHDIECDDYTNAYAGIGYKTMWKNKELKKLEITLNKG